jgi:protein involved in polysaccharide export with SLBB domain
MDGIRRGRGGRLWLLGALLLAGGGGGCASFSNPTLHDSIPVHRLPPEVFGKPREEQRTIPLTLLRQKPPVVYLLDEGDLLGIFIEGVLGERNIPIPYIQIQPAPGAAAPPPAVGYPIPVQEGGRLVLPLIEPINVKDKSVTEAADLIRDAYLKAGILRPGQNRVIVSLAKPRVYHVTVIRQDAGGVIVSGAGQLVSSRRGTGIPLDLEAYQNDVLNALARSGGLPGLDASNTLVIQRGNPPDVTPGTPVQTVAATQQQIRIPLRLRPNEPLPFRPEDTILKTGDIIYIESRDTELYYTGGLLPVGEFILPRDYDLDVMEAVTQARGPLFNGAFNFNNLGGQVLNAGLGNPSPSLLTVIRKTPNCGQITIRVDLNRAAQDQRERILVQPGDFLILQETPSESLTRYITQKFTFNFLATIIRQNDLIGTVNTILP